MRRQAVPAHEDYDRWRLVWVEPSTGRRQQLSYPDQLEADVAWSDTVAYVEANLAARPPATRSRRTSSPRTVDDLFVALEQRWELRKATLRYRQSRQGIYRTWVQPVCGGVDLRSWAATDKFCLQVLDTLDRAGRAPATRQNVGSLLKSLVTVGHTLRWLPKNLDPMLGVPYTAKAFMRGEGTYVEPKARPTTAMVAALADALADALTDVGASRGLAHLGEMSLIGGFSGLRFGEQTALRPGDYDPVTNELTVQRAWAYPTGFAPELKSPKNGYARRVFVPATQRPALLARIEEASDHGDDALLFPGPKGPCEPLTEPESRKLFIAAARQAGWVMVGDAPTRTGLIRGGHPELPYRNLRHHAATWMRASGLEWSEVARMLGHHSPRFTQDRYERPGADSDERLRRLMEDL